MTDCLDSWAIIRWLEGTEPAANGSNTHWSPGRS